MKKRKGKECEAFMAKGRSEKKSNKETNRGRSKFKGKVKKCFYCHKEGHIRKKCFELITKRKSKNRKDDETHNANIIENYDVAEVLTISDGRFDT